MLLLQPPANAYRSQLECIFRLLITTGTRNYNIKITYKQVNPFKGSASPTTLLKLFPHLQHLFFAPRIVALCIFEQFSYTSNTVRLWRNNPLYFGSQVTDVHALCSLVKDFLRVTLKEPIITFDLRPKFIEAAREVATPSLCVLRWIGFNGHFYQVSIRINLYLALAS